MYGDGVVCQNWSGANAARLALFRSSFVPAAPLPSAWGEILVSIASGTGLNVFAPHGGGPVALGPLLLPLDLTFYGRCFVVQGLCGDTPRGYLSNALVQTIGN